MCDRKPWAGQEQATRRYQAKVMDRHSFNLNRNTDQDIIAYLDGVDNLQGYIKQLIRADMKRVSE